MPQLCTFIIEQSQMCLSFMNLHCNMQAKYMHMHIASFSIFISNFSDTLYIFYHRTIIIAYTHFINHNDAINYQK